MIICAFGEHAALALRTGDVYGVAFGADDGSIMLWVREGVRVLLTPRPELER